MIKKSFPILYQRLPKARPWAIIAFLLAMGLMGYYAILGVRYWQTTRQVNFSKGQLSRLSEELPSQTPKEDELATKLALAEQRLEGLYKVYSRPEADAMMALIFSTASDAQVDLSSMVVGELAPKVKENVQYQTQPVTVNIRGGTASVSRFLATLQQRKQVVAVAGFQMGSLDSTPSAQVQLLFYLSPKPMLSKPGTTNAIPPTPK